MDSPVISFITVDYNGLQDTKELVQSILEHVHSVTYEIIIVDNASKVDDAKAICEIYGDKVTTIRSEKNLGFAGGNNLGLKQAKGDYIFFINNDTVIEEDHLNELILSFKEGNQIGGISPKIRFAYPPQHIQYAGFTDLSSITLRNRGIGFDEEDKGQYNTPAPTFFLHGAAMIIKREVIEKVGPMSDVFFLYYEEMDWCARIRRAGYQLKYEPCQTIFHKESRSTGKSSPLQVYYLNRNRLLYAWRNLKGIHCLLSLIYLSTIPVLKNSLQYILRRQFRLAFNIYKAIFAFIVLPHKMK